MYTLLLDLSQERRYERVQVHFLSSTEVDALLSAPDCKTSPGRRDHALLMVAVQTGMRLSELTSLKRKDVMLGTGAHVRCIGKCKLPGNQQ